MKKGFTMIEVLGIIVIIALISVFSFPLIRTLYGNIEESKYQDFLNTIYMAAETYIEVNYENISDEQYISVKTLVEEGYLSNTLLNPNTSVLIINEDGIIVSTKNPANNTRSYEYIIEEYINIYSVEDLVDLSISVSAGNSYSEKVIILNKSIDFSDVASYEDSTTTTYGDLNGNGSTQALILELTTLKGFPQIGNNVNYFSGTFVGNGYKIDNLYINTTSSYIGLFGYLNGAYVSDLVLNGIVSGGSYTGVLAGYIKDSTVKNVVATVSIASSSNYVGALSGAANNSTIEDIIINYQISTSSSYIGGLVGNVENSSIIKFIDASGTIESSGSSIGSIAGIVSNSSISNATSKGKIIGLNNVGGIVGSASAATLYSLENTAIVNAYNEVGGIVGSSSNSTSINECHNFGIISGNEKIGGIVGAAFSTSTITKNYSTKDINGVTTVGGLIGLLKDSSMTNNYAVGGVAGTTEVGGLIGRVDNSTVSNSYCSNIATGTSIVGSFIGQTLNTVSIAHSYVDSSIASGSFISSASASTTLNDSSALPKATIITRANTYWDTNIWNNSGELPTLK